MTKQILGVVLSINYSPSPHLLRVRNKRALPSSSSRVAWTESGGSELGSVVGNDSGFNPGVPLFCPL